MNIQQSIAKERATYSLDRDLMSRLAAAIPKSKRSAFVEEAILEALRVLDKDHALKAIRDFKPYPLKGPGTVETIREGRMARGDQLASSRDKASR